MARSIDYRFYNRKKWKEAAKAYKESVFGLCERCGKPGDHVHHKIELNRSNVNDPNIAYNFDNLELLCIDCHNKATFERPKTRQGLIFNKDGDLVEGRTNGIAQ